MLTVRTLLTHCYIVSDHFQDKLAPILLNQVQDELYLPLVLFSDLLSGDSPRARGVFFARSFGRRLQRTDCEGAGDLRGREPDPTL
jgi:hypothetical protein